MKKSIILTIFILILVFFVFDTASAFINLGNIGTIKRSDLNISKRKQRILDEAMFCSMNEKSVKVYSPNGGELYKAGDKMVIKWQSCNVPSTEEVDIELYNSKTGKHFFLSGLYTGTLNDGIEVVDLSGKYYTSGSINNNLELVNIPNDNNYQISVNISNFTNNGNLIIDYSDRNFTIGS